SISKARYYDRWDSEQSMDLLFREIEVKSFDGYRVLVFDDRCLLVNDSNGDRDVGVTFFIPEVVNALSRRNDASVREFENTMTVYASASIENEHNIKVGAVLLVSSAEDIYAALSRIQQRILMYTLLVGLFMCVLVFFVSQLLIDPLKNILKVVRKMADGHLNQRINVRTHDEYNHLGQAFNHMAEKLEQVEKTREEFVSNVSHELKTPLSSIKVLSDSILIRDEIPIETYREFLEDITQEVDRMTMIVNDLLTLVKIDQREYGLTIKPTDLNVLVEDVLKRLSPLAEQKKIALMFYEENRKAVIEADAMKISLAISNIVENGIKYTPPGGTVKVTVDADHQNAFVTVTDTGIGINEEEQSKVFNRFYRVDKTRDRETGGTGLGLAISHSTVLLHNGSIRLVSKLNEGSVFSIRLPIHYSARR
ncbi:MAG: cell wall metabolism sensor histidine kinase WalK, partial [Defluviitaleaceae bacterium]|nr:cell wall metabolism sensor histidine kinase WalK [Defluviitaleaceae bacterium]